MTSKIILLNNSRCYNYFLSSGLIQARRETVIIDLSMTLRLLVRMKFSALDGFANSTMAVALSLTLMLRTLPAAVVIALMRSKLIMGGKLEIITRLLWPPVLVILGFVIGVGTLDPPNVGMLLKLLLAAGLGAAGLENIL